jgi:urease accessory protein UreF
MVAVVAGILAAATRLLVVGFTAAAKALLQLARAAGRVHRLVVVVALLQQ